MNIGSITDDANMNLSGSGDVIYAYISTDKTTGPFTFLGAIATAAEIYSNDGANPEADGTLERLQYRTYRTRY
ncbi:MAG: hypothetical protein U5J63_12630 [Fodinibius sp.]|nr:hypothetical protein [Fodinibius sp.]